MFTNFEKTLIVYAGFTGTKESTKDDLYSLCLDKKIWSKISVLNSGEQLSNFTFEKLDENEILIFGGQNFLK